MGKECHFELVRLGDIKKSIAAFQLPISFILIVCGLRALHGPSHHCRRTLCRYRQQQRHRQISCGANLSSDLSADKISRPFSISKHKRSRKISTCMCVCMVLSTFLSHVFTACVCVCGGGGGGVSGCTVSLGLQNAPTKVTKSKRNNKQKSKHTHTRHTTHKKSQSFCLTTKLFPLFED